MSACRVLPAPPQRPLATLVAFARARACVRRLTKLSGRWFSNYGFSIGSEVRELW